MQGLLPTFCILLMIITPDSMLRVMIRVVRSGNASFACIIIPQITPGSELAHRKSAPDAGTVGARVSSHRPHRITPSIGVRAGIRTGPSVGLAEIRMGFLDFSLFIVTLIAALHHHQPADQPFLAPFTPGIVLTLLRLPVPLTSTLITKAHSLSSPSCV